MDKPTDSEALVRQLYDSIERGDFDGAVECFADTSTLVDNTDPTTVHRGKAAIGEAIRAVFGPMSNLKLDLVTVVEVESLLAAEGLLRATMAGQVDSWEMPFAAHYEFRDGKILYEHVYYHPPQLP